MIDVDTLRHAGPAGMTAAVFIADMVPGAPTQPIAITTGALFGFKEGLACVCAGQAAAAGGAVLLARSPAARGLLSKAEDALNAPGPLKKSLDAISAKVDSQSALGVFGTIVGVRQTPVIPFSLGNYYLGLFTRAPLASVVAGTVVGCFPLNALWTYVGATTSGALQAVLNGEKVDVGPLLDSPLGLGLSALGVVATVALLAGVGKTVTTSDAQDEPSLEAEAAQAVRRVQRNAKVGGGNVGSPEGLPRTSITFADVFGRNEQ